MTMLAVALLVGAWNTTTSGYSAAAPTTVSAVPVEGIGSRTGSLLAYAQTQLGEAATTSTATPPATATTTTTTTEPASLLAASDESTPPSSAATTTTTAPTTTTTTPPTTTTHTHATTTTHTHATTTTTTPPTTTTHTHATTTTTSISIPPSPGRLSEEQAIALFSIYFKPEDVDTALRVAKCESNLDPSAWNPNGHGGLFQHAISAWDSRAEAAGWPGASIFDAEANTAVSAWLLYKDGWWHWTCY